jgi:NADPH:quinone reductase-like Zn-dependent oxidoreductase
MKAAFYMRYGSAEVIEVRDVQPLPEPTRKQVKVRIAAAALNPKDLLVRKGKFRFFTGKKFPLRFGYDFAGTVVEGGGFKPGARVFGMVNGWIGRTVGEELFCTPDECVEIPEILSFTDAAGIPLAALTALQALRDLGNVTKDSRVLINGASGGVGVFAIQIAKALGAKVTTLSSEKNITFCQALGADEALDYAKDDPFSKAGAFDVIFDVFGNRTFAKTRKALTPKGVFVSTVPSKRIIFDRFKTLLSSKKAALVVVKSNARDLIVLRDWIQTGRLRPVIDSEYPLRDVRKAQCRLETKRARGKVIVNILQ